MRIFLSYAAEHRRLAESIAIRLKQDDHEVFFDRQKLAAGEEFDRAIRREIARSDLFIYLISPESVAEGSYALTELGLAQKRRPNPSGRLLPVMISPTPMEKISPYASAVTLLQPRGNAVAEVAAEVASITRRKNRRRIAAIATAMFATIVAAAIWNWWPGPDATNGAATTCLLRVQLASPSLPLPSGLTLRLSGGGESRDFSVTRSGTSNIDISPIQVANWSITVIDRDGATLGSVAIDDCPASGASYGLDRGISLEVLPRV